MEQFQEKGVAVFRPELRRDKAPELSSFPRKTETLSRQSDLGAQADKSVDGVLFYVDHRLVDAIDVHAQHH